MTESPDKPPNQGEKPGPSQKKPRGMGGILIIFLLLMTLFWAVSNSSSQTRISIYEFWRLVYNGELEKVEETPEGQLIGTRKGKKGTERYEVTVRNLTDDQRETIQSLQAREIDEQTYQSADGLQRFLEEFKEGRIGVLRAWVIHWASRRRKGKTKDPAPPQDPYMTAIILAGNQERYVKLAASDRGPTIQTVSRALNEGGVRVDHFAGTPEKRYEAKESNTLAIYLIGTIAPWVLIIGLFWFFIIRQMRAPGGSGGVLSFGRSRAHRYSKEQNTKVTFEDVEGMDEAKEEVREIIEFLKNRGRFQRLGGRIPRGVLLIGPPGTGKTLLAKAIAGEADVPFFSISGSDFVEMFVGVGASRVRDLFKQARDSSPCLIFLDEIDAVGRKRGSGVGGGHDEREQTLNAILVEMDGFDSDEGIILIGATNRPDVLDPALLRPGRFDRQVAIDMPDVCGRQSILRVHARKIKHAKDLDFDRIARATPGFSGAELASLINEAAILAAMRGDDEVRLNHCEEARDRVRWGREKRSRRVQEEDRKVTAYHEAGHSLVGARIPEVDPVHKITIVSRGMALGATMYLPEKDDYHMRRSKLLGMLSMTYGGRIAEDIVFGDISAGAQNDIRHASRIARTMVTELGMSEKVGPLSFTLSSDGGYFLGQEFMVGREHSEDTARLIDEEVRRIVDECYQRAHGILEKDRALLDTIAEALLEYETISGEELDRLIEGVSISDLRPAPAKEEAEARAETERAPEAETEPGEDLGLSGAEGLATP